jgi:hypothetical protein
MSYGIQLYGPDGQTVVFSDSIRTSNIQVRESRLLGPGPYASEDFPCPDADDPDKVIITFVRKPTSDRMVRVWITRHSGFFRVNLYDLLERPADTAVLLTIDMMAIRIG